MDTPAEAIIPATPVQHAFLNRQVDLDVTLDQLWSLVSESANLTGWLADDVNLDMSPGSVGTVVDDGVERSVRVDRVVPASRLEFTWWPIDEPSMVSVVVLQVEALPSGSSRLGISETLLGPSALTAAGRWETRVLSLWACTVAMALVR